MITSTANSRIRELVKLKRSPKDRAAADAFLVEGPKMFSEIPEGHLQEAYASESYIKSASGKAMIKTSGHLPEIVSDQVFQHLSDTQSPQGILAVVSGFHYSKEDILGRDRKALILVLENIQDPGNLGTIFRTAEAAGATGIVMSAGCADVTNPKVVRSTMGGIFRMPYITAASLKDALNTLKKENVRLFAASLQGSSDVYTRSFTGSSAFLIGNESRGLTEEAVKMSDQAVRIPMNGRAESLNAAVASAVLLYEACRQRRQAQDRNKSI